MCCRWFRVRRGASAGLFTAWVESTPRLIGAQGPPIRAHIGAASPAGRARAMVLRLESALAGEPDVYVSPLEDRRRRVVAIPVPAGTGGAGGCSRVLARKNRGPLAGFLFSPARCSPRLVS